MSEQRGHIRISLFRRIVLSGILLLVVATALYIFAHRIGKRDEILTSLEKAEAQWASHPIRHYHLNIKYAGVLWAGPNYAECVQDVEVIDEQVGTVFQDTCKDRGDNFKIYFVPRVTVSGLFTKLRDDMTVLGSADSLICDGVRIIQASYDPKLGYPTSAVYKSERPSVDNLGFATYWQLYGLSQTTFSCLTVGHPVPPTITADLQTLS